MGIVDGWGGRGGCWDGNDNGGRGRHGRDDQHPLLSQIVVVAIASHSPCPPNQGSRGWRCAQNEKRALMVIALASSHPHVLQEVNGNGSFVVVVEKN